MGCRTQQQLSVDVQNRIRSLSRDLPQLWADPAVIDRERKEILALLIQDGTILSEDHSPPATAGGVESVSDTALYRLSRWHYRKRHPHPFTSVITSGGRSKTSSGALSPAGRTATPSGRRSPGRYPARPKRNPTRDAHKMGSCGMIDPMPSSHSLIDQQSHIRLSVAIGSQRVRGAAG